MAGASLPPGFRFHPTDVELIMYYLKRKVMGKKLHAKAIAEVNIYKFSPWDLPDKSCLRSKDLEWFFFCPREKKYASGVRVKRATENGYWKTTGKDRHVHYNDKTVGTVKTLVFHLGHAPVGQRTDWVMHEYVILDDNLAAAGVQDTYVLCKLFKKNGPGPKNGAQYGAPFNEDDWADNDVDVDDAHNYFISSIPNGQSLTPLLQSSPKEGLFDPGSTSGSSKIKEGPNEKINSVSTQLCDPGNTSWFSEGLSPSAGPSTKEVESDDDIVRLLASFTDESMLLFNENGNHKDDRSSKMLPCLDGYDIYNGLEDLHNGVLMNETRLDFSGMQNNGYPLNNILLENNLSYLELNDLLAPLNCSAEVNGTNQLCNGIFGSYSLENMLPLCSCEGQLHVLPNDSNKEDSSLDVIETINYHINEESNVASYGLEHALIQPENGKKGVHHFSQDMKRGESIQSSAVEYLVLSFFTCDGSSIHIKAEVTCGDGECTKEALSVMMEESSSCRCNCHLSYLVDVGCQLFIKILLLQFVSWGYFHHAYNENSCSIMFEFPSSIMWFVVFSRVWSDAVSLFIASPASGISSMLDFMVLSS